MIICASLVFSAQDLRLALPNSNSKIQFPTDSDIGECAYSADSPAHSFLLRALSEPYSLEWSEEFLHPDYKKNITKLYSSVLSEILPAKNVLFSKAKVYSDGSEVVTAKFVGKGYIVSFALRENKIYAVLI